MCIPTQQTLQILRAALIPTRVILPMQLRWLLHKQLRLRLLPHKPLHYNPQNLPRRRPLLPHRKQRWLLRLHLLQRKPQRRQILPVPVRLQRKPQRRQQLQRRRQQRLRQQMLQQHWLAVILPRQTPMPRPLLHMRLLLPLRRLLQLQPLPLMRPMRLPLHKLPQLRL